jgi:hypothetical protein
LAAVLLAPAAVRAVDVEDTDEDAAELDATARCTDAELVCATLLVLLASLLLLLLPEPLTSNDALMVLCTVLYYRLHS